MPPVRLGAPARAEQGLRVVVCAVALLLAIAAELLASPGPASGQAADGPAAPAGPARLGASVRGGRVVVEGTGFAPAERLTVRVQTRGVSPGDPAAFRSFEVAAVADEAGAFAVATDAAVPPVTGADLFVMYGCAPAPLPTPVQATPGPRQPRATACERVVAASVGFAQAAPPAARLPRTGGARDVAPLTASALLVLAVVSGTAAAAGRRVSRRCGARAR